MKILVAEDDFTSRVLLQELLKSYGPIHVVVNGSEAVDAARMALEKNEPYDLICLDIMMPGLDGQEALRMIRELEAARGINSGKGSKILMTTALGDAVNVMSSFFNLCTGYIVKPIQKAQFYGELRKMGISPGGR